MKTNKAKSKPKTPARQKAQGCRRPSSCSASLVAMLDSRLEGYNDAHKYEMMHVMAKNMEELLASAVANTRRVQGFAWVALDALEEIRLEQMKSVAQANAVSRARVAIDRALKPNAQAVAALRQETQTQTDHGN